MVLSEEVRYKIFNDATKICKESTRIAVYVRDVAALVQNPMDLNNKMVCNSLIQILDILDKHFHYISAYVRDELLSLFNSITKECCIDVSVEHDDWVLYGWIDENQVSMTELREYLNMM